MDRSEVAEPDAGRESANAASICSGVAMGGLALAFGFAASPAGRGGHPSSGEVALIWSWILAIVLELAALGLLMGSHSRSRGAGIRVSSAAQRRAHRLVVLGALVVLVPAMMLASDSR